MWSKWSVDEQHQGILNTCKPWGHGRHFAKDIISFYCMQIVYFDSNVTESYFRWPHYQYTIIWVIEWLGIDCLYFCRRYASPALDELICRVFPRNWDRAKVNEGRHMCDVIFLCTWRTLLSVRILIHEVFVRIKTHETWRRVQVLIKARSM